MLCWPHSILDSLQNDFEERIFQKILTWYFASAAMVNMEELAVLARWVAMKIIYLALIP